MSVQTVDKKVIVTTTTNGHTVTAAPYPAIDVSIGTPGKPGTPGPPGPEGGTPVVAIEYDDWPPVDPQPNTLYLRLAP